MNFTPNPAEATSAAFSALLDAGLVAAREAQPKRSYIGGSRLGDECERKLAYEYHHTAKDDGKGFKGRTYRIFDMGHDSETRVIEYLRLAGFSILTERKDGGQFGFWIAPHPETGESRISGHCDGILTAGPDVMQYPAIFENKALGAKSWKDTLSKGVKRSKPIYYAQVQIYMAYLGLQENPALFMALNRDTGEIYAELVPFDQAAAQAASDRGARVVSTLKPEEAPRVAREATDFRCKFCDYADRCWEQPAAPAAAAPAAQWWTA